MAITLEATYAKKLGLPNYSSHSFLVTIRTEVRSLRALEGESARLYRLLQSSVDKQVQEVGFIPDATKYGMIVDAVTPKNGKTKSNGNAQASADGADAWLCSDKQRGFIV